MLRKRLITKKLPKRWVRADRIRLWTSRVQVFSVCQALMHTLKRSPDTNEIAEKLGWNSDGLAYHLRKLNGAAGLPYPTIKPKVIDEPDIPIMLPLSVDKFFDVNFIR